MTISSKSSENTIVYKTCPNCHLPVPEKAKFCRHCGYKFIVPKPAVFLFRLIIGLFVFL
ncbi:MAG: zinc ribbon domain-containing protein [Anaerolineaceae bacterium]|nr:zinc ribbon domain-containing protein [Anaerolineaceae bacterium]